jgi:hypothetical protein
MLSLEFRLVAWYRGRPCGGNHSALTRSAYVQCSHNRPVTAALLPRFCQTMMASSINVGQEESLGGGTNV